jgi:hypothetical protein
MNYWADCLAWRERRRELLWEAQERALARAVRKTREGFRASGEETGGSRGAVGPLEV